MWFWDINLESLMFLTKNYSFWRTKSHLLCATWFYLSTRYSITTKESQSMDRQSASHQSQGIWDQAIVASEFAVQIWVPWTLVQSLRVWRKQPLNGRNIGRERVSTYIHCNTLSSPPSFFSQQHNLLEAESNSTCRQRNKLSNYYRLTNL